MADTVTEMQERSARINALLKGGSYPEALTESYVLRAMYEREATLDANQQRRFDTLKLAIAQLEAECVGLEPAPMGLGDGFTVALGTKREWRQATAFLIIATALVCITYLGVKGYEARATRMATQKAYETYAVQARAALEALEKIQAGTRTGISFQWYGDKLADASFFIQRLDATVQAHESLKSVSSYHTLTATMASYASARDEWQSKIRAEYGGYEHERRLQAHWEEASASIGRAKRELDAGV